MKIIVANWKMNGCLEFINKFVNDLGMINNLNNIIICAPYPYLLLVNNLISRLNIKLGSQDISMFSKSGSFTGEVSDLMLKDCFVEYVILGHSERRNYFKEDNIVIKKKLSNCIENFLIPILCVGEDLHYRKNNTYKDFIYNQLQVINDVNINNISNLIIAYEPVWAIGTSCSAKADQIMEIHKFIFDCVKNFNLIDLKSLKIIYGGSVSELNYNSILNLDYVDGILVGGASLQVDKFRQIVNYI